MSAGEAHSPWTTPRRALVVGDLMLDVFTDGRADRLSPEAPVPVVLRTGRRVVAGGAGNAAANLSALGDVVSLVGVIGADDPDGAVLTETLEAAGVVTDGLVPVEGPTTSKHRIVAGGQHVVRLDVEGHRPLAASAVEACLEACRQRINSVDVVLVSDYAKGVCTSRLCSEVIRMAKALGLPVVVDPKGKAYEKYRDATVITPNLTELKAASGSLGRASVDEMANDLRRRLECNVLVTRSADGMSLYRAFSEPLHLPTEAQTVFDVTGAGDTVASVVAAVLARGIDLDRACSLANSCAGLVVGRAGTSPITRDEMLRLWKARTAVVLPQSSVESVI